LLQDVHPNFTWLSKLLPYCVLAVLAESEFKPEFSADVWLHAISVATETVNAKAIIVNCFLILLFCWFFKKNRDKVINYSKIYMLTIYFLIKIFFKKDRIIRLAMQYNFLAMQYNFNENKFARR
jgi:hypothetical protein